MIKKFSLILLCFFGLGYISCQTVQAENIQSKVTGNLVAPDSSPNLPSSSSTSSTSSSTVEEKKTEDKFPYSIDNSSTLPRTGEQKNSSLVIIGVLLILVSIRIRDISKKEAKND